MPSEELDLEQILKEMIAEQTNSTIYEIVLSDSASISDQITIISNQTYSSVPTGTSILGVLATPTLDSIKENYAISDVPEFELEFFDEHDALLLEIVEIDSAAQLLLSEIQTSLAELNANATSTQSDRGWVTIADVTMLSVTDTESDKDLV